MPSQRGHSRRDETTAPDYWGGGPRDSTGCHEPLDTWRSSRRYRLSKGIRDSHQSGSSSVERTSFMSYNTDVDGYIVNTQRSHLR